MAFLDFARGFIGGSYNRKPSPTSEAGVPGFAIYNGWIVTKERNAKLVGQNRYITAANILTNISIVAAGTRYFLNLASKPAWQVDPADESAEAAEAAEFIESVIDQCNTGWSRIIRRSGMYKYHGFGIQEWTARKRDDGKIGILDIEPRPQHTIERWDVEKNGDVLGVIQRAPQDGQEYYLPRRKIVYLVDDTLTDNPEGLGWFRQLVEPAERVSEYLRLEKVGFQKDLGGIPIGRAPISEIQSLVGTPKPGGGVWTQGDINTQLAGMQDFMNMETRDNKTGMILDSRPYQDVTDSGDRTTSALKWGVDLLTGKAEGLPHMGEAINRQTQDMARIMGVENILTGSDGVGSQALSKDKSQNLYLAVNSTINDMRECYERDIIGPVCDMNGIPEKLRPRFKVEDVAFKDVESIAAVLRDMASAGAVLQPDDPAIDDVRMLMGVSPQPEIDPALMGVQMPAKLPGGEDELPDNPEDGGE